MRNEKKFIINELEFPALKFLLFSNSFVEFYPQRKISSLYYDTDDLKLFFDSENGISNRQKIRIRWYNDDLSSSTIEYKIKKSELGDKKFVKISNLDKKDLVRISFLNSSKNDSNNLFPSTIDKFYIPKALISYQRNYFLKDNLRITYDRLINFNAVFNNNKKILILNSIPSEYSVLEIKYEEGDDYLFYNTIQTLSDKLGLTLTRFSKYSNSIRSLYC